MHPDSHAPRQTTGRWWHAGSAAMHGRLVRVTPPVIGADVGDLRAQSQAGRRLPCREWPGVSGPGGIGLMSVCCRAASLISPLSGHPGSGRWGRRRQIRSPQAIAWPSVRPAPLSSGQDKYFARAQHAVGLAGRFELEFQLPLNREDQIGPVRGEPVLVDGLGQLAHPDHFDALPENTVPTSPNGVDQTSRARPSTTLKTSGAGPQGSWIVTRS